ncbi:MAG: ABC transporter substrate-binding protein [Lactobacillales bacterium]|jgi:branched-chain amino acid transport system substrate-binding protein|nr:ABC transporter substrate-binding protein [Lactobacillales bacterium]
MKAKIAILGGAFIALLVVAGVLINIAFFGGDGIAKKNPHPGEIYIGANLELSGNYRAFGLDVKAGMKYAIDSINREGGIDGKKIHVEYIDNKNDSTNSREILEDFAKERYDVMIGPNSTASLLALREKAEELKLPVITPLNSYDYLAMEDNVKYPYMHQINLPNYVQIEKLAKYAFDQLALTKIVVFYDPNNPDSKNQFDRFKEDYPGDLVEGIEFNTKLTDYAEDVKKLAGMDYDGIFVAGAAASAGLMIKELRDGDVSAPILTNDKCNSESIFIIAGEKNIDNVYMTSGFNPLDKDEEQWTITYKTKTGQTVNDFSYYGYQSVMRIFDAYKSMKNNGSSDFNAELAKMGNYSNSEDVFLTHYVAGRVDNVVELP